MDGRSYRAVEPLYASRRTSVWRAMPESQARTVVLKRPVADPCPSEVWDAYRREADLLGRINHPNVVKLEAFVDSGTAPILVLEDVGGVTLAEWRHTAGADWREGLDIAADLARALAAVHEEDIVHLAVAPGHVLVSPSVPRVQLIDFQHAQRLERREPLAADLYALGATLYFLFTGRPPLPDASGWAPEHAHVARTPIHPKMLAPELPSALAELILRLLSEEPDDRYPSAAGVVAVLAACRAAAASDPSVAQVALGRVDDPVVLPRASRLYGDDPVTRAVLEAWPAVRYGGAATILIRGAVGSGKSVRLRQAAQWARREAGLVLVGAFAPDRQAVPYASLLAMLDPVVDQLLKGPDAEVAAVRTRLAHRLGPDAGLLTGISHWETLMGEAMPLARPFGRGTPDLRRALVRLVQTLSQDRPVVLAWDDVDWADPYSEGVMRALVGAGLPGGLLIIAAATASDAANLEDRVRSVWGTSPGAHTVALPPLDAMAVRSWLAAIVKRPLAAVADLAQVLTERSAGNPAAVQTLLETLWRAGAVRYDRTAGGWVWDLAAASALGPPNAVRQHPVAGADASAAGGAPRVGPRAVSPPPS